MRENRKQYGVNRAMARMMTGFVENKLMPVNNVNESSGIPIQLGALAYYKGFVVGGVPSGWDSSLVNLAGTTIPNGTGDGERVGDYVYLQKTHLSIEIEAQTAYQSTVPKEYRVIVVKSRQSVMPAGQTMHPQTSLFLNTAGETFGYSTGGINGTDLMLQPINKRNWSVYCDKSFHLSNPVANQVGNPTDTPFINWTGQYPSAKRMVFDLPYYAKTHYSSANVPGDLDTHYLVYVFARSIGKDYTADDWEVNVRGTTTYKDL